MRLSHNNYNLVGLRIYEKMLIWAVIDLPHKYFVGFVSFNKTKTDTEERDKKY